MTRLRHLLKRIECAILGHQWVTRYHVSALPTIECERCGRGVG